MQFFKILPLKFWIVGGLVILLGVAAYQTFIGDRQGKEIETASTAPFPSFGASPSSASSPTVVPSSNAKMTSKPSVLVSASPSSAASTSPSPSAAASSSPAVSATPVSSASTASPQLNSLSPTNPAPGSSITLSGTNFGSANGAVSFYDSGIPAGSCNVSLWGETQIVCTLPESLFGGKEYGVQITTSEGKQTAFKYYTLGT